MSKIYSKLLSSIFVVLLLIIPRHINAKDSKEETDTTEEKEEVRHLISIRGFVVDDFGEPMVGVEVYAFESDKECITNSEGKYTIWAEEGDLIKFSQIGVIPKKEKAPSSRILNVALSIEE